MPIESGDARPRRDVKRALLDGFLQRCPACGVAPLFGRYLKVRETCAGCGQDLHHHRADDAPAYFTILVVGHVIVGAILPVEKAFSPPLWLYIVALGPITLGLTLWLLPRIKGVIVGLQWALYMHGFGAQERRLGQGEAADPTPDQPSADPARPGTIAGP